METWPVDEVARLSGTTTRTLRHYDAIGLLTPVGTGPGGRRLYGRSELERLQRVLLLRELGLGLGAVAAVLDGERDEVAALQEHQRALRQERARTDRLLTTVGRTVAGLRTGVPLPPSALFDGFAYVHGYDETENRRLDDQADALVGVIHDGTAYPPGSRVLEVGCGVGAQSRTLLERNPGIALVCVDRSAASVAETSRRVGTAATVLQADLFDLPFAPGTFDHVFVCFVLEHLDRPADALAALVPLLRPGGTLTAVEGDHGSVLLQPDDPDARAAVDCQVQLQARAGGDACLGRGLGGLLLGAGLTGVAVEPRTVLADATRPDLLESFTRRTFTAMVAGVRDDALAAGLTDAATFDAGVRALSGADVLGYTFVRAVGSAA